MFDFWNSVVWPSRVLRQCCVRRHTVRWTKTTRATEFPGTLCERPTTPPERLTHRPGTFWTQTRHHRECAEGKRFSLESFFELVGCLCVNNVSNNWVVCCLASCLQPNNAVDWFCTENSTVKTRLKRETWLLQRPPDLWTELTNTNRQRFLEVRAAPGTTTLSPEVLGSLLSVQQWELWTRTAWTASVHRNCKPETWRVSTQVLQSSKSFRINGSTSVFLQRHWKFRSREDWKQPEKAETTCYQAGEVYSVLQKYWER